MDERGQQDVGDVSISSFSVTLHSSQDASPGSVLVEQQVLSPFPRSTVFQLRLFLSSNLLLLLTHFEVSFLNSGFKDVLGVKQVLPLQVLHVADAKVLQQGKVGLEGEELPSSRLLQQFRGIREVPSMGLGPDVDAELLLLLSLLLPLLQHSGQDCRTHRFVPGGTSARQRDRDPMTSVLQTLPSVLLLRSHLIMFFLIPDAETKSHLANPGLKVFWKSVQPLGYKTTRLCLQQVQCNLTNMTISFKSSRQLIPSHVPEDLISVEC